MTTEEWTNEKLDKLAESLHEISEITKENSLAIRELREESKEINIRFNAYQQASQWVVNLAFSLIAGATIITVASAIFKR